MNQSRVSENCAPSLLPRLSERAGLVFLVEVIGRTVCDENGTECFVDQAMTVMA